MSKLIGIVTVLYNSESVLDDFFTTLSKQSYKNFILYIIDNKSPDNSLVKAKELSKQVNFKTVIIENSQNDGVAKGNNLGIEQALKDGCDYVLLSNNDIVLYEDTIENLLASTEKNNVFVSVPKILIYDNKNIWYGGGVFDFKTFRVKHIGIDCPDSEIYNSEKYVTYSPTCVMLIHKSVFGTVGIMDEKYFVYWDDTDFVYRLHKAGIKILYVPTSCLEHKESVCTGNKSDFFYRYIYRNREYFINKFSRFNNLLHFIDFLYLYTVMRFKMRKNLRQWKIVKEAMKEGCKMFPEKGDL